MDTFTTKDSGKREGYVSGMVRDVNEGKARFDLIHPKGIPYTEQILTRFANLMSRGAVKYGERNWEKALGEAEMNRFKESATRHLEQWICGEMDEDHAVAVLFNIMGYETTKYKLNMITDKPYFVKNDYIGIKVINPIQPGVKDPSQFITPYIYRYTLGDKADMDGDKFIVYHKGEKRLVTHNVIEFASDHKLGMNEFMEFIKGTAGIIGYNGEFK